MRFLFLLLAFALSGRAAEVAVLISAPPSWVDLSVTPNFAPTPAADTSYGYDYLLLDRQVNVREEARYYRTVYRLTTENSLQDGGRVTWGFDPAYERLTVHHVRIIRDGVTQERLQEGLIKTIQQERDLDRHLLNGQLTGLAVLDDVRVGDVVDYAFTREGWNPAFRGNYFDTASAGWSIPVRHARFQVSAPAGRPIGYKSHGDVTLAFSATRQGDEQVLLWEGRDLRPIESESETPSWFTPYPHVRLSEFDAWSDVVKWAEPMYAIPSPMPAVLAEQAARLTRGLSTDADKTVALLQFVQQEVRYLGLELGAGSYQPTDPAVVLARRFGDCKDKTLLFCTLMQAAGLSAYPALLDTDWRDTIDDWMPTPHAFDHVIACIPQADGFLWVDPTLMYQQGELQRRGFPDYRRALVVQAGQDALTKIVVPSTAQSEVRITERFDIVAFDQPARFEVTTTSSGLSADSQRSYFATTTPEQIAKHYVNYYATAYPGLTRSALPVLTDDARNNVVTVVENYEIPDLWSAPNESGEIRAEFFPKPILDYAARPDTTVRTMPLRVSHPTNVQLTTTVNLPEAWKVTPEDRVIESHAFRAKGAILAEGKVVTMTYGWESRAHHVPAKHIVAHVKDLNRFRDSLGYSLTYTAAKEGASSDAVSAEQGFQLNWKMVVIAFSTMGLAGYAGVWATRRTHRKPSRIAPANPALTGLGGWLILVAIGVTLRPITLLVSIARSLVHAFDQAGWDAITEQGSAGYQPFFGPLLVAEVIGNSLLIAGSIVMLVLFYQRRRAFPLVFIVNVAFSLVFLSLDTWAGEHLVNLDTAGSAESYGGIIGAAMQAFIWIPYMLISERVKSTFVQ
jgi:hypothetical protein